MMKNGDLMVLATLVLVVVASLLVHEQGQSGAGPGIDSPPSTTPTEPSGDAAPQCDAIDAREREAAQTQPASAHGQDRPHPRPFEQGTVQLGPGGSLGGRRPFPDTNPWNEKISTYPVDPRSQLIIESIGVDKNLHPDFGAEFWNGAPNGIPYAVVGGDQPGVPIVYTAYKEESDPGPFPIPPDAPIEGGPHADGDRHVLVIDRDQWMLYELFRAFPVDEGKLWRAESGAVFNLTTGALRPEGWTSADAAGLPIFPGLVRYDEVVELGEIRHALRFTVRRTRRAYVPPARHWASRHHDAALPPMGMRVRLKQDYDLSRFPREAQVILTALKEYGMILADNGSDWFLSGAPDARWNDQALRTLKRVKGGDFEVVLMSGLVADR